MKQQANSDAAHSAGRPVQSPPDDHDLGGALAAIKRAALSARKIADQTGTDLIVVRSGQLVRITPGIKPCAHDAEAEEGPGSSARVRDARAS